MTKQRSSGPASATGRDNDSGNTRNWERSASAAMRERHGDASANQDEPVPTVPPVPPVTSARRPERRTAMERLMADMRVDVGDGGSAGRENNQEGADDYADVSLELLALLSPHGTTQQWEDDDDDDTCVETTDGDGNDDHHVAKRLSMLARVDLSEYGGHTKNKNQRHEPPDLTSPTQHLEPFQVSPAHSAHGDELDLASPVALPESPQQGFLWANEDVDDQYGVSVVNSMSSVEATTKAPRASPSTVAQRAMQNSSRSPPPLRARTPGKAAVSTETKTKARHGGIYSLLLKNKPPEHEPMLVDEKRSPLGPEESPMLRSVSKRASPPPVATHGGIYSLLRQNSKGSE